MLVGILSVQLGAAIAKGLFGEISPTAMVWLRLVTSALVLAAIARPRLTGRTRHDWLVVLGFGASLATMNWAIYQSFSRIPLGIAVTIEFIGPLTLAVLGSRHARDVVWVLLAGVGVVLLGFQRTRPRRARRGVRPARRRRVGGVHPAQREHRAAVGRVRRPRGREHRRRRGDDAACAADRGHEPVGRPGPADRRARRAAELGHPLQLRARRAAEPAARGVRDPDEPRAGRRGPRRDRRAAGAPALLQWLAIACVVAASIGATRSAAPGTLAT